MPVAAGRYSFDLVVTDAAGAQTQRTFTLNVSSLVILPGSPRDATTGVAYAAQFVAAGGTRPYTFTIGRVALNLDMLPPGFNLSPDGLLSGTTTSTGVYFFTVTATDAAGNAFSGSYTLSVANPSGLLVASANPSDAWVGRGRQLFTLSVRGTSTYTWSLVDGVLPPGTSLIAGDAIGASNTTTFIGGAPTTPGTYTFTLRATDNANPANFADHAFTYRVAPMQIVSPPIELQGVASVDLPVATAGAPYSFTLKAVGGTSPYTFVESSFNPLPAGLTLSADGTLEGTPQSSGSYVIVPIITDAAGFTVSTPGLTLIVTASGATAPLLPLTSGRIDDASVGSPFSFNLDVLLRGGAPTFTWELAAGSALPDGLSLQAGANGAPSYLRGVAASAGAYSYALVVSDAVGQTLTITFRQTVSPISVEPDVLPIGAVGAPYSVSLVASGTTPPYTIKLSASSDLPPGLNLDASGLLSGTPTNAGNFLLVAVVSDGAGNSLTKMYAVTIDDAALEAHAPSLAPDTTEAIYSSGPAVM
jgi:hypothetical protein